MLVYSFRPDVPADMEDIGVGLMGRFLFICHLAIHRDIDGSELRWHCGVHTGVVTLELQLCLLCLLEVMVEVRNCLTRCNGL